MSQPPLSQQIKELESELQVQLLNRTRRSVEMTPAGRAFLDRARRLLADAAELKEVARRADRGDVGELTAGFVHSAGYSIMPLIVREFRASHPGVTLALREQTATEQIEELARGRIEVGFARPVAFGSTISTEPILREPFVLALPASHVAANVESPSLAILKDEEFITFPRSRAPAFHDAIIRLCSQAGFVPRNSQETNTIHTALGLVGAGIGIAIVPASAMQIRVSDVVFRLPRETEPKAELVIAWRQEGLAPAAERFLDTARLVAARYQQSQDLVLSGMSPQHRRPTAPGSRAGASRRQKVADQPA